MPGSRVGFTQRFHCRFQFALPIGILVWRRARATRHDANTRAPGQKLVQIGAAPHPGASAAAASSGLQAAFSLRFPECGRGLVAAVEGGFGGGEEFAGRHAPASSVLGISLEPGMNRRSGRTTEYETWHSGQLGSASPS
ncbi:MAG: hypothetical protein RL685_5716 [Pseudomonadota bacterium]